MTDREARARLKIKTAERDVAAARIRLRAALLAGDGTTTAIRREIEALAERVDIGNAELAEMQAAAAVAKAARLSTMSATIAADARAALTAKLSKLRPPVPPKPINEETPL